MANDDEGPEYHLLVEDEDERPSIPSRFSDDAAADDEVVIQIRAGPEQLTSPRIQPKNPRESPARATRTAVNTMRSGGAGTIRNPHASSDGIAARAPILAPQRTRPDASQASTSRGQGTLGAPGGSGGVGAARRVPSARKVVAKAAVPVGTAAAAAVATASRRRSQRAISPAAGPRTIARGTSRAAVSLPHAAQEGEAGHWADDALPRPPLYDLESVSSYFAGGLEAYSPRTRSELETYHLQAHVAERLKPIEEKQPIEIWGRVGVYCNAEKYDGKCLEDALTALKKNTSDGIPRLAGNTITNLDTLNWQDDALHVCCHGGTPVSTGPLAGKEEKRSMMAIRDIFFFEWGLVVFWGFEAREEKQICDWLRGGGRNIAVGEFDEDAIEVDEYDVVFTAHEEPKIENDTITMAMAMLKNSRVKLAVSYAIAQSTKLSIFEERIQLHTEVAVELPKMLATTGKITTSRTEISKLIGQVVLEKCAMNLLSTVMDTPEFFWDAPDSLQELYDAVCEYLEVEVRITVLNARFDVLNQMLDMLRDHQNNEHSSHLEWIVIILIVIEVIIGFVEIAGFMGWIGHGSEGPGDKNRLDSSFSPPCLLWPPPPMG